MQDIRGTNRGKDPPPLSGWRKKGEGGKSGKESGGKREEVLLKEDEGGNWED